MDPPQNGKGATADIGSAKERFERGELALDAYLDSLLEAHRANGDDDDDGDDDGFQLRRVPRVAGEPAREPGTLLPGMVLGRRFELEERLADSGSAQCYRARDLLAARHDPQHATVCLAILDRRVAADEAALTAALHKATQVRALHHPNIAQITELHSFDDRFIIASEWLEGESLAQRLEHADRLPADEMKRVLTSVAAALEHAHSRGLAHGDLRPENVLVTTDGRVKVTGFGVRAVPHDTAPAGPGRPADTANCASCEVLEGREPEPADDIYSVACLIYRMRAGVWPHALRDALAAEFDGMLPSRPPGLTSEQWQTLQRALAFRKIGRPATLSELVTPFLVAATAAQEPASRTARRPLALLAALLIGVALAWFAWREDGPATPTTPPAARPAPTGAAPAATAPPKSETATSPTSPRDVAAPAVVPPPAAQSATPPDVGARAEATAAPVPAAPEPARTEQPVVTTPPVPSPAPDAPVADAPRARPSPAARPVVGFATGERVVVAESASYVRLPVRSQGALQGPVIVTITARSRSAEVDDDFALLSGSLTLNEQQPSGDVLVAIASDATPENVEDFTVILRLDGDAGVGTDVVTVVVTDDD